MNPITPQIVKGSIVVMDRKTGATQRIITLQYNPDSLNRTLSANSADEGADRLEANRLTGPPTETISLEAELDAADQLEFPKDNETVVEVGLSAQLAALEILLYPSSQAIKDADSLAGRGSIEILPAEAPMTVFSWGKNRLVPVRITEFSVVEEAFDIKLNPIRAKISLGMRVLSINDLPFNSYGGSLYMVFQEKQEQLAQKATYESGQ
ncbi:MAG: hypothetical protein MI892_31060 [Desulfobacterales bacterium]|nr:hypothetical protein [Desulfobacterales bacterium]